MRRLLDPVEAEMAMVSWGFLDSVMVACPWMQASVWVTHTDSAPASPVMFRGISGLNRLRPS